MCLAQGPQRSDADEARTRGPSVSSQALYHWGIALLKYSSIIYRFIKRVEKNRYTTMLAEHRIAFSQ